MVMTACWPAANTKLKPKAKATSAFRRYTVIPNTWMDNVASY